MMKNVTIISASEMNNIWTELNCLQREVVERLISADVVSVDIREHFEKIKEKFE